MSISFSLKNRCKDASNLHIIELGTGIRIDCSERNSLEHAGRNAKMHVDILRPVHFIGLLQRDDVLRVVETLVCVQIVNNCGNVYRFESSYECKSLSGRSLFVDLCNTMDEQLVVIFIYSEG